VHQKTRPSRARSGLIASHLYSLTDIPGALPVNTLGRGWSPTPESKAMEPTTINTSVIAVPAINTNGLITPGKSQSTASQDRSIRTYPLTSFRSHFLPAQYCVRPAESLVASHAQVKHFRPALYASTHAPWPEHASVELEQTSSEVKHNASEPTGGNGTGDGRGD